MPQPAFESEMAVSMASAAGMVAPVAIFPVDVFKKSHPWAMTSMLS